MGGPVLQWALLNFEAGPVLCPKIGQLLGSRLDVDPATMQCRIAFFGPVALLVQSQADLGNFVRLFKIKERLGVVDRVDGKPGPLDKVDSLIGRGMFQKGTFIFFGFRYCIFFITPFGFFCVQTPTLLHFSISKLLCVCLERTKRLN